MGEHENKMKELADSKFDTGNFECGIAEVLTNLGKLMDAGFEQKDALKILSIGAEIRKSYSNEQMADEGLPLYQAVDEDPFKLQLSTEEDKPVQICADESNPVYATSPQYNPVELCTHEDHPLGIKSSEFYMECSASIEDVTSHECQHGCHSCCDDEEDISDFINNPADEFSAFVSEYALSDNDTEQLRNAFEILRKRQSYSDRMYVELKESGRTVEVYWGEDRVTGARGLVYYMVISMGNAQRNLLKIMNAEQINDVVTRASLFGMLQTAYNERNPNKIYKTPITKNKVLVMAWKDKDTLDVYLENKEA